MQYLFTLLFVCSLLLFHSATAQADFQLLPIVTGFDKPVDIANAGDERLFIVEKRGTVRIVDGDGQVLPAPFLDIRDRVRDIASEQGLLGLAFHPDYENNGWFFVNYTGNDENTRIARFTVSADPDAADEDSEVVLMTVDQPFDNHNAGDLSFGPDGYLYFGLGDGGAGDDPLNAGQDRLTLLGKMIRIDVDNGDPYAIPEDNPFAFDDFTLDEIWALGLRNPWRFSFDRETGDLWIGDVGQDDWEEINRTPAGGSGGENYGWRCYEGNEPFIFSGCDDPDAFTPPVHTYVSNFSAGCSVTGGFVYRGSDFPNLYGKYIYADYCTGRFWTLTPDGQGGWINTEQLNSNNNDFATFGEDQNGELYVAGVQSGTVFRIQGQTTATADPESLRHFILQPNPASDHLRVDLRLKEPHRGLQLVLRDLHGRTVLLQPVDSMGGVIELNTGAVPAGFYLLGLEGAGISVQRKVVIE